MGDVPRATGVRALSDALVPPYSADLMPHLFKPRECRVLLTVCTLWWTLPTWGATNLTQVISNDDSRHVELRESSLKSMVT